MIILQLSLQELNYLVLAGFSATLGDGGVVGAADLAYNFFVEEGDVGRNVAEASARGVSNARTSARTKVSNRCVASRGALGRRVDGKGGR